MRTRHGERHSRANIHLSLARRIPLPRLTQRQRSARWQRERRQQTIIVIAFSAILFLSVSLVAWAAATNYYTDNLTPAARVDGRALPVRDYRRELKYQLAKFYGDFGVPVGSENDPQIAQQKAQYDGIALEAVVAHAILDGAAKADGVGITGQAVDERYARDLGQFRTRHVLVVPNKDASDKDAADKAALAKAQDVAKQLQAAPNDQELWNKLAKESSDDTGSKDQGGELGFAGHGQFVKEYEDAVNALAVGQVSDPVKSQFGYHVIQLEERRAPEKSDLFARLRSAGFSVDDVKAHVRYDLLQDEFTKRAQDAAVASPTGQVHAAKVVVDTPPPSPQDFTTFSNALKKLSTVTAELEKGTDFAEVAKQYSDDAATKDSGGDIGWLARGMITDLSAENELFSLGPGQRGPQHSTRTQTSIYKVLEKDPARALDDTQKQTIKDNAYEYWLQKQKLDHVVKKLVPGLEFD